MTTFSLWWLLYGGVRGALIVGVPLGLVPLIVGCRRGQAKLGKIGFLATVAAGFALGAAAAVLVSLGVVIAVVKRRHGENTILPEQGPQPIKDSGSKPREIAEAQPSQWPTIRNGLLLMVASPAPVLVMFPFESGSEPWLAELATYVVAVPMFLVGVVLLVAGVISSFGRNGGSKCSFPGG